MIDFVILCQQLTKIKCATAHSKTDKGEITAGNFAIRTTCEEEYKGDYRDILLSIRNINRKINFTFADINLASEQVDSGQGS